MSLMIIPNQMVNFDKRKSGCGDNLEAFPLARHVDQHGGAIVKHLLN